ncbi:MAG: DUF3105 domain-containing protein [Kofleriaceae bacterium]|nr:DUF3105 domain-containing protein [Kofleriaceae bacterium]
MIRYLPLLVLAACSSEETVEGPVPVGGCDGLVTHVAGEPPDHVATGSTVEWSTNPPATGAHYGSWAAWDRHYENLPRGTWLHNAEHGGVIVLYNCPDGCPDVVGALYDVARAAPVDPTCTAPVTKRIILAADPFLPEGVQIAAVAWNTFYTASCLDPYLQTFVDTHFRHGLEDTCAAGNPAGGSPINP